MILKALLGWAGQLKAWIIGLCKQTLACDVSIRINNEKRRSQTARFGNGIALNTLTVDKGIRANDINSTCLLKLFA